LLEAGTIKVKKAQGQWRPGTQDQHTPKGPSGGGTPAKMTRTLVEKGLKNQIGKKKRK